MPELKDVQCHFRDGKTHSLRSLVRHFGCEPVDVLRHLTRRNGFVERINGKTSVWDMNPILAEVAAEETGHD